MEEKPGSFLPLTSPSHGVFVKPQQDGEYRVYSIDGSESASRIDSFPNSSPSNFFGLSRSQRSQGPEIAEIVQQNDRENCNSVSIHECLVEASKDPPNVSAQNSAKDKTMCGELIFLHTKPTIWSYQDFSNEKANRRGIPACYRQVRAIKRVLLSVTNYSIHSGTGAPFKGPAEALSRLLRS
ncbi:SdpA family antimicrobial peptide system protein [Corynebacterium belfantii]|uniref:SdpA family antimicrobial peptide system protein n=1 Tax=Corynebacterium belfantii TaxID=2014537 RepID=UPI0018D39779|nr:SdpA family antimicrobial peptide system protein [Corynebacterium belfantii]MBG9320532.1 SdpA family antimicrobial peptide system protein [Corynebacterium belfantii]MBG9326645.1 SdpA family antimicrobial peptide system protein [Corynebacterium belfantii]MBG9332146.1 SdpA family antimicrobial peptide system protein [Corynebacterium belfantii]MBG9334361.1 SdpA family antimicrobial peptide system protein [Corynebacterium belfantii]